MIGLPDPKGLIRFFFRELIQFLSLVFFPKLQEQFLSGEVDSRMFLRPITPPFFPHDRGDSNDASYLAVAKQLGQISTRLSFKLRSLFEVDIAVCRERHALPQCSYNFFRGEHASPAPQPLN